MDSESVLGGGLGKPVVQGHKLESADSFLHCLQRRSQPQCGCRTNHVDGGETGGAFPHAFIVDALGPTRPENLRSRDGIVESIARQGKVPYPSDSADSISVWVKPQTRISISEAYTRIVGAACFLLSWTC